MGQVGIQRGLARFANGVVHASLACLVIGVLALSFWAVAWVQWISRDAGDPLRYWYLVLFVVAEAWAAAGLTLARRRVESGAWVSAVLVMLIWLPSVGLSAYQEWRFHSLSNAALAERFEPHLMETSQLEARALELGARLEAIEPVRPLAAIDAELERYRAAPERYPTRLSELNAERALSLEAAALRSELSELRDRQLVMAGGPSAVSTALKRFGADFSVPGSDIEVSESVFVWCVIVWGLMVKSLGPYVLWGGHQKQGSKREPKPTKRGGHGAIADEVPLIDPR